MSQLVGAHAQRSGRPKFSYALAVPQRDYGASY